MRILVGGATGLIGSAVTSFLSRQGHEMHVLTRKENQPGIFWNPDKGVLKKEALENFDAIINLAGDNIASGRWSEAKKKRIKDSRVNSTKLLADTIAALQNPPKVYINASAIGYYGTTEETVDENSPNGKGFLAEVCKEWEIAAKPAEKKTRTVFARFGAVLSSKGGALAAMLIPFKLGLGGKVGSGKQWMSWIAIDDVVRGIEYILTNEDIKGPVNFTAPEPVRNEEFTKQLGKVLKRPTFFPLPAVIAKFMLGEMAEEVLLSSVKAEPKRLEQSGYRFLFPHLKSALTHLLGKV